MNPEELISAGRTNALAQQPNPSHTRLSYSSEFESRQVRLARDDSSRVKEEDSAAAEPRKPDATGGIRRSRIREQLGNPGHRKRCASHLDLR